MKYQIKILLISICIIGIGLSQDKSKKVIPQDKIIQVDPGIKHWDVEDKNIKNPKLQKLLEELKMEYNSERENLKKQFKKRVDALRKEYANKRENLKKKYRKKNKKKRSDKIPEKLNPKKKMEENNDEIKKGEKIKNEVPLKKVIDTDKKTIDKK